MEASNLFHPMAYLGPKDLDKMKTEEERFQAELQAVEFGIVPDILFGQAHPLREDPADPDECVLSDFGRAVIHEGEGSVGPDGEMRTGEQAWELLESPSNHSHDDMKGIDRMESSESTQSNKLVSTSLGFGSAALVPSAKTISMAQKHTQPASPPATTNDGEIPATPGGKAKSSWASNLSLPSIDGLSKEGEHGQVGLTYPIIATNPSMEDQYRYLGSVPSAEEKPSRTLPLSGSGDLTRSARRSEAIRARTNNDESRDRQRRRDANPSSPQPTIIADSAVTDAGWDLKIIENKQLHSDSVRGCSLLVESRPQTRFFLTTVSLDGTLMVHTLSPEETQKKDIQDVSRRGFTGTLSKFAYIGINQAPTAQSKLTPYRKHTSADPLACLAQTNDGHGGQVVFAGGHDDVVLAYGINSACAVASVYSHRDAVTGLDIIARPAVSAENVLWSEKSTHIMVSGSWDATVKVWSVTVDSGETVSIIREPLAELFDADSSVECLSATAIDGSGVAISAGCADGSFIVWLCHDDGSKCFVRIVLDCYVSF